MLGLLILFSIQLLVILFKCFKVFSSQFMINFLRFSYGSFLIFSGTIKLIDPLGFSYKLQKYFDLIDVVFLYQILTDFGLYISVFVCLFEILLGVVLIYGRYVKPVLWSNLLLMIFFTFLTFFAAVTGKISDCGCFGDFLKLDPWHSFYKDIHLLFVSILLLFFNSQIKPLFSSKITMRLLVLDFVLLIIFTIYTLTHIPVIDFTVYKIGTDIAQDRQLPEDAKQSKYEHIFLYELNGDVVEVSVKEVADFKKRNKSAKFQERITKEVIKGDRPKIEDFDLDLSGLDMTDSILNMERVFLIVSYDIDKASLKGFEKIQTVLMDTLGNHIHGPVYGLSSSDNQDIVNKLGDADNIYEFCKVDGDALKTIIRSSANPGVVMLNKGIVKEKWHWRSLPKDISSIINP